MFELTKTELLALLAFASRDETRAHLNGLGVNPAEGWIAATDGHTLVRRDGYAPQAGEACVVPFAVLDRASKLLRRRGDLLRISLDARQIRLTALRPLATAQDSDGATVLGEVSALLDTDVRFPPIDQVIPSHGAPDAVSVGLDASYMARLALVQRAAGVLGLRVHMPPDDVSPLVATCDGWITVIMPRRV